MSDPDSIYVTEAPPATATPTPPPPNESRKDRKAREKLDREASKQAARDAKLRRYAMLRANVRRRRAWYAWSIVLAIVVFLATCWDIVFNDSDLKWYLLGAYVVLFIIGIIALFSGKRHMQEVNEIKALERAWLECETCRSVFQFGSESFLSRRRVGFTCPVCGEESALPLPGVDPVERPLPAGQLHEHNYVCGNCKEDIVVGVYGGRPRDVDFRACPRCGTTGEIRLNIVG